MKRFSSGMIANGYPVPKGFPFRGKGWTFRVVDYDPHGIYKGMRASAPRRLFRETRCPKEILIHADSEHAAQRAAQRANDLLWAALALVNTGYLSPPRDEVDGYLMEHAEAKKTTNRRTLRTGGVVHACMLASRASFRQSTVYALAKYHLCTSMCSVAVVDLDPYHSARVLPKLSRPTHAIQAATAITLAYGVVEQLGLEVRASFDKPSRTSEGLWNLEVKRNLEQRLDKAGVDLCEQVNWNIRGPRTTLEAKKPRQIHKNSTPSPWSRWPIRDRMVDVVDAIAHLSWLRSKVSSHRLNHSMVRLLSAYDIANSQFLARRLLLERLGAWKSLRDEALE